MSEKFWDKVTECKHKNISPNYCEHIYCETPFCFGYELHCLDCGVYISECKCGYCNGLSGWSSLRWKIFFKKTRNKGK